MTRVLFATVLLLGCGGGGGGGGDGGPIDASAEAICTTSCQADITCGLGIPEGACVTECEAAPGSYRSCVTAAGADCDALSACFLATECNGAGPTGTGSCATAQSCEESCNTSTPTTACGCGCVAAMSPTHAFDLLVGNLCEVLHCSSVCTAGSSFDGAQCNACYESECSNNAATCSGT